MYRFRIEEALSRLSVSEDKEAFQKLALRYKQGKSSLTSSLEEKLVYLQVRLPATFTAVLTVLEEVKRRIPSFAPLSLLDVGSGPGTSMWAALEAFPELSSCVLLEKDLQFMNLARQLMHALSTPLSQQVHICSCNMETLSSPLYEADLVTLSYALGEVPSHFWERILRELWKATKQVLCIVEPGTPRGYKHMMQIRTILLSLEGYLIAPCPHQRLCPLLGTEDWCHFSCRVSRSALHRKIKSGSLNYEDEKFCYMIFSKTEALPIHGRIIRHPLHKSGHTEFVLCCDEGIVKCVSSKKEGELYKQRRKLSWGDAWI